MNNEQPPEEGPWEVTERHFGTFQSELEGIDKMLRADKQSKSFEELLAEINADHETFYKILVAWCAFPDLDVSEAAQRALAALKAAGKGKRELLAKLGKNIPLNTYQEARAVQQAIVEGHLHRNWHEVEGDTALCHRSPKDPNYEVHLEGKKLFQYWDLSPSYDSLWPFVEKFEVDAALCYQLCLYIAVMDDRAPIETDELIRGLGWVPRTTEQRNVMRRKVWSWVTTFASMSLYGNRPGKPERWRDKMTGKTLDLRTRGPLIIISSTSSPEGQLTLDGSDVPIKFTLAPGDWLAQFRGNRQVLATLGNIWKIAAIPGGQPSGAWARAYGFALLQRWRERAAYGLPTFTREDLHLTCPCKPSLFELLDTTDPKRAITYDRDAWVHLHEKGTIATDPKSLTFTPKTRQGWKEDFLKEELTIQPGPDIQAELNDIRPALNPRGRKK
jgi:hypothetical protein